MTSILQSGIRCNLCVRELLDETTVDDVYEVVIRQVLPEADIFGFRVTVCDVCHSSIYASLASACLDRVIAVNRAETMTSAAVDLNMGS